MRIGISGSGYGLGQVGGLQVYLRELLRALAEADAPGHEYVVFCSRAEESPPLPASPRFSAARLQSPAPRRRPLPELLRFALGWPPAPHPRAAEIDGLGLDLLHFATTRLPPLDLQTPVALTFFGLLLVTFLIGRVVPIDPVLAAIGDRAPQEGLSARPERAWSRPAALHPVLPLRRGRAAR